jgi:hypothetical protein
MTSLINRNQGIIGAIGLVLAIIFFFLPDHKIWAAIIMGATIVAIASIFIYEKWQPKSFDDIRKISKILFIDDKDCQIVTNLQRSNFDVRKIDNVLSPGTDKDVQWSNIIFVDYKDIGKKLFW